MKRHGVGKTARAKVLRQERTWSIWGPGSRLDLNHYLSDAQMLNGAERVHTKLESKANTITGRVLKAMLRT